MTRIADRFTELLGRRSLRRVARQVRSAVGHAPSTRHEAIGRLRGDGKPVPTDTLPKGHVERVALVAKALGVEDVDALVTVAAFAHDALLLGRTLSDDELTLAVAVSCLDGRVFVGAPTRAAVPSIAERLGRRFEPMGWRVVGLDAAAKGGLRSKASTADVVVAPLRAFARFEAEARAAAWSSDPSVGDAPTFVVLDGSSRAHGPFSFGEAYTWSADVVIPPEPAAQFVAALSDDELVWPEAAQVPVLSVDAHARLEALRGAPDPSSPLADAWVREALEVRFGLRRGKHYTVHEDEVVPTRGLPPQLRRFVLQRLEAIRAAEGLPRRPAALACQRVSVFGYVARSPRRFGAARHPSSAAAWQSVGLFAAEHPGSIRDTTGPVPPSSRVDVDLRRALETELAAAAMLRRKVLLAGATAPPEGAMVFAFSADRLLRKSAQILAEAERMRGDESARAVRRAVERASGMDVELVPTDPASFAAAWARHTAHAFGGLLDVLREFDAQAPAVAALVDAYRVAPVRVTRALRESMLLHFDAALAEHIADSDDRGSMPRFGKQPRFDPLGTFRVDSAVRLRGRVRAAFEVAVADVAASASGLSASRGLVDAGVGAGSTSAQQDAER